MPEYIERDALDKVLSEEASFKVLHGEQAVARGLILARDYVESAPAADVETVVHGEWTSLTECSNEGVYCSVCHKKVWKADYAICTKTNKIRSNYCPNCGAKMDKEDSET